MSLARTALRLVAVEALKADPVLSVQCGERIFDSRMSDFDRTEPVPVIVVTTDDEQSRAFDPNNGGVPFDATVDLTLEIAMKAVAVDADDTPIGIGSPATDRELEAALDLLEECAVTTLTVGETAQAKLVRRVSRRVPRKTSSRFITDETGEKLAIRLVVLSVELRGEDQLDATIIPTGAFASLPNPLRTVCEAFAPGSTAAGICTMLAAAMAVPTIDKFEGADLTLQQVQALNESGPPSRGPPDGTPELSDTTMQIDWS